VRKITKNNKGSKDIAISLISSLVDTRTYSNEEYHKVLREKIPEPRE